MKPPSGECNGDIGAADISENKNVTPAVSVLAAWRGPIRSGLGRGLTVLQGSSARLHRPSNLTGAWAIPRHLPWTSDVFVYFMGRSDGGLALSPSDLQRSTQNFGLPFWNVAQNRSGPRRLSREPTPIEQFYRGTASTTSAAGCSSTIPGSRSVSPGKGLVSSLAQIQLQVI